MFCLKCGNELNEGAAFCPQCGSPVNENSGIQENPMPKLPKGKTTKKGKNLWKTIAIIAGVFIVLIVVIGSCGKSGSSSQPEVGKTYYFGEYPQSGSSDKKEDILWDVVAEENGNYMLLSHYILDYQPYDANPNPGSIGWSGSGICSWLNNEFANTAFNEKEMERIEGGVKLLSIYDVEKIMSGERMVSSNSAMGYLVLSGKLACAPTEYAKSMGVKTHSIDELTSPPYNTELFESIKDSVNTDAKDSIAEYWLLGEAYNDCMNYGVTSAYAGDIYDMPTKGGIRPVIWIKGEKTNTKKNGKLANYNDYLGDWKCVADIMSPDGQLQRYGTTIVFTDKGIDCTDLFALDSSWSYISDLKYYNEDGNDYYVDPSGDPVGFYYDKENQQMVLFTPSQNYPSSNPYDWNKRFRFEKK